MKIFLAVFFCLFFAFNIFGQVDQNENIKEVGVEEISLARDDGSGKPGDTANGFLTSDVPIHCFVQLASMRAVLVKMNFVAAKAAGLKAETKVVTVSYKTNGKQISVNFNASPETVWAAGAYRVDVLLDGKLAKSLEFEIKKSTKEISKEKQPTPKVKSQPKAKRNPRTT